MNDTRSQQDRARRAAKRVGLKARKSRWRAGSIDNFGDFQIIDPKHNWVVAGAKFDCTADDVVEFCAEREPSHQRRASCGQ
jgi:hypothetical protein